MSLFEFQPADGKMHTYPAIWMPSQQRGLSLRLRADYVANLVQWLNERLDEEHGDLVAQRDALVEACEAQQEAIERIIGLSPSLYADAQERARYALTLVRGEDGDG